MEDSILMEKERWLFMRLLAVLTIGFINKVRFTGLFLFNFERSSNRLYNRASRQRPERIPASRKRADWHVFWEYERPEGTRARREKYYAILGICKSNKRTTDDGNNFFFSKNKGGIFFDRNFWRQNDWINARKFWRSSDDEKYVKFRSESIFVYIVAIHCFVNKFVLYNKTCQK